MAGKDNYIKHLKEALSTFTDIPKEVDVKGPMVDPILGYDGSGEMTTYKDAASILERYYFKEQQEDACDDIGSGIDNEPPKTVPAEMNDVEDELREQDEPSDDDDKEDDEDEKKETELAENTILQRLIREMEEDETEDKMDEKELDVDEELDKEPEDKKEKVEEGDTSPMPGFDKRKKEEELSEMFKVFREQIEDEEDDDEEDSEDSDDEKEEE